MQPSAACRLRRPNAHCIVTTNTRQGINVLYEFAKGSLDQAGTNFQRLAEATILRVPPELYLEQVG